MVTIILLKSDSIGNLLFPNLYHQTTMLKLFISYSHNDEATVKDFIKFTAPIRSGDKAMFELWYDRKMRSGTIFWEEIRKKINEVDGAILFISADYLNSPACIEEKDMFIRLQEERGILVLPLIVKKCLWMEDPKLKCLLALTTDAKPLSGFASSEDAWMDVADNLKRSLEKFSAERELKTSPKSEKQMEEIYIQPYMKKESRQTSQSKTSQDAITINFSLTVDKDQLGLLQDIIHQMNMVLSVVDVSHFDGDPDTAHPIYQISGVPSCVAAALHCIHDTIGAGSLADIRYMSEADSFERDNLTLLQTIQLIDHINADNEHRL